MYICIYIYIYLFFFVFPWFCLITEVLEKLKIKSYLDG